MHVREYARKSLLAAVFTPVLGAASLLGLVSTAHAASSPVTFAQVLEASSNGDANVFNYTNNGTSATFGTTVGATVSAEFTFESGAGAVPLDLAGVQDATITLTSSTSSAVASAFGGTFADEKIGGTPGSVNTLTITRETPAAEGTGSRTNLLTVTFTGDLTGFVGGATASLSGGTSLQNTVIYSSDFLSFADAQNEDFNVALSSWAPLITPPSGLGINMNNFFNSATAAGVATFDVQTSSSGIPEPASLPTAALASMTGLLLCGRQLRQRIAPKSLGLL
jgi:hypothetical protein